MGSGDHGSNPESPQTLKAPPGFLKLKLGIRAHLGLEQRDTWEMKAGADTVPCWYVPVALTRWLVLSHNFSRTNLPISSFTVREAGSLLVFCLFCAKGSHVGRVPCVMSPRSPAWRLRAGHQQTRGATVLSTFECRLPRNRSNVDSRLLLGMSFRLR